MQGPKQKQFLNGFITPLLNSIQQKPKNREKKIDGRIGTGQRAGREEKEEKAGHADEVRGRRLEARWLA